VPFDRSSSKMLIGRVFIGKYNGRSLINY
jgi:hypothetical protein